MIILIQAGDGWSVTAPAITPGLRFGSITNNEVADRIRSLEELAGLLKHFDAARMLRIAKDQGIADIDAVSLDQIDQLLQEL